MSRATLGVPVCLVQLCPVVPFCLFREQVHVTVRSVGRDYVLLSIFQLREGCVVDGSQGPYHNENRVAQRVFSVFRWLGANRVLLVVVISPDRNGERATKGGEFRDFERYLTHQLTGRRVAYVGRRVQFLGVRSLVRSLHHFFQNEISQCPVGVDRLGGLGLLIYVRFRRVLHTCQRRPCAGRDRRAAWYFCLFRRPGGLFGLVATAAGTCPEFCRFRRATRSGRPPRR